MDEFPPHNKLATFSDYEVFLLRNLCKLIQLTTDQHRLKLHCERASRRKKKKYKPKTWRNTKNLTPASSGQPSKKYCWAPSARDKTSGTERERKKREDKTGRKQKGGKAGQSQKEGRRQQRKTRDDVADDNTKGRETDREKEREEQGPEEDHAPTQGGQKRKKIGKKRNKETRDDGDDDDDQDGNKATRKKGGKGKKQRDKGSWRKKKRETKGEGRSARYRNGLQSRQNGRELKAKKKKNPANSRSDGREHGTNLLMRLKFSHTVSMNYIVRQNFIDPDAFQRGVQGVVGCAKIYWLNEISPVTPRNTK